MRRAFLMSAALSVVALAGGSALGQTPEGRYEKGRLTEISDLLSDEEREGCSPDSRRLTGTVAAVRFSRGRMIGDFTLRTFGRQTVKIEISPALYDRITKQDATALPTLVSKTRRITVDVQRCGGKDRALYIISGSHPITLEQ